MSAVDAAPLVSLYPGTVLKTPPRNERAVHPPTTYDDSVSIMEELDQLNILGVTLGQARSCTPNVPVVSRDEPAGLPRMEASANSQHKLSQAGSPPRSRHGGRGLLTSGVAGVEIYPKELKDFGGPFYTDEEPDLELVTPFLFSHRKKEDNGSNSKHTSHSVPTLGEHSQLQARMTSKEAMDEYEQRRATTPNPITLEAFEQESLHPQNASESYRSNQSRGSTRERILRSRGELVSVAPQNSHQDLRLNVGEPQATTPMEGAELTLSSSTTAPVAPVLPLPSPATASSRASPDSSNTGTIENPAPTNTSQATKGLRPATPLEPLTEQEIAKYSMSSYVRYSLTGSLVQTRESSEIPPPQPIPDATILSAPCNSSPLSTQISPASAELSAASLPKSTTSTAINPPAFKISLPVSPFTESQRVATKRLHSAQDNDEPSAWVTIDVDGANGNDFILAPPVVWAGAERAHIAQLPPATEERNLCSRTGTAGNGLTLPTETTGRNLGKGGAAGSLLGQRRVSSQSMGSTTSPQVIPSSLHDAHNRHRPPRSSSRTSSRTSSRNGPSPVSYIPSPPSPSPWSMAPTDPKLRLRGYIPPPPSFFDTNTNHTTPDDKWNPFFVVSRAVPCVIPKAGKFQPFSPMAPTLVYALRSKNRRRALEMQAEAGEGGITTHPGDPHKSKSLLPPGRHTPDSPTPHLQPNPTPAPHVARTPSRASTLLPTKHSATMLPVNHTDLQGTSHQVQSHSPSRNITPGRSQLVVAGAAERHRRASSDVTGNDEDDEPGPAWFGSLPTPGTPQQLLKRLPPELNASQRERHRQYALREANRYLQAQSFRLRQ